MLKITGLVEHTIDVPPRNTGISRVDRIEDFHCLEGWVRPDQSWSGLPLDQLIRLAKPRENERFIEVASGDFVAVLSLSDLDRMVALLANPQNGCKPTQSNRGAWRLIVFAAACYYSVKMWNG
jgi:DMSO/TMAO reductase YedYZ molybdopterin-dependent catalytic subunit